METNPKNSEQFRNSPQNRGEAEAKLLDLIQMKTTSSHLSATMQEVASVLGKEELVEIIAAKAAPESSTPNAKVLISLDELFPGFIELLFVRMQEIQEQTDQSELDAANMSVSRKFGRTVTGFFRKKR